MDDKDTLSPLLPDEIIEEILSRLPVKSVLKFRCVSKPWRSSIGSERFIKIQFKNSTKDTSLAHHRVISNGEKGFSLKQWSLQPLLDDPSLDPSPVYDPTSNRPKAGHVVGHCNGLLCLRQQGRFLLWNPATRITTILPETRGPMVTVATNCGFGWDEASGAYKVIAIHNDCIRQHRVIEAYSSKTNSWRIIENVTGSDWIYGGGEVVGGKLDWLSRGRGSDHGVYNMVTLDLKSEAFGRMELPCVSGVLWYFVWLKVVRGFLSFFNMRREGMDLWVMKKESWEKVMVMPVDYGFRGSVPFVTPLYIGSNREILLLCQSTFLVYKPDEDRVSLPEEIMNSCAQHYGVVYVESLVSPVLHKNLRAMP